MDWSGCSNLMDGADGVASIMCLEPLFASIIRAIMALVGVALFVMFIIAGFNFLTAGGDQKKLEKAKGTLGSAITGLVIVAIAILILRGLEEILGLPTGTLTTFRVEVQ